MKTLPQVTALAFPLPPRLGRAGEVVAAAALTIQRGALASPIRAAITTKRNVSRRTHRPALILYFPVVSG
jgi:hypothetical protein